MSPPARRGPALSKSRTAMRILRTKPPLCLSLRWRWTPRGAEVRT